MHTIDAHPVHRNQGVVSDLCPWFYIGGDSNHRRSPNRKKEINPSPQKQPLAAPGANWCGTDENDVPDGNWGLACKAHDACYATPGANKESCDARLAVDMYNVCNANSSGRNPVICTVAGFTYGAGLILFGPKFRMCGPGGCGPTIIGPSRRAFDNAQRGTGR